MLHEINKLVSMGKEWRLYGGEHAPCVCGGAHGIGTGNPGIFVDVALNSYSEVPFWSRGRASRLPKFFYFWN